MINLPGCIVLSPGVTKKCQIRKIQRLDKSDRQRYFRYDHSILIKAKVVRYGILNNLYLHEKLPILYCSPSGSLHFVCRHSVCTPQNALIKTYTIH